MRLNKVLWMGLMGLVAVNAQAAVKDFDVKYSQAVREDDRYFHENHRQPYGFRMEVVSDSDGIKPEGSRHGRPFVTAEKGERYSVRLYNPLPVRVAVNLTVDGLNSISGKPSGISDGQKWMIEPYGTVTIPGWQVNGGESRRFFFTNKPKSYAKWMGDEMDKDLAANCGVIGAAFFWSQRELDGYYENHPICRYTYHPYPYASSSDRIANQAMGGLSAAPASRAQAERSGTLDFGMKKSEPREQAGTGMGERESHPTYEVAFNYDRGMYSLSQALVIYYGFGEKPVPNPFPALGYAPEMP